MRRFLFINPFGIGDVLFTTPMIKNIKHKYPNSFIGYLCNIRTKDILLQNPFVDKVYIFEKDEYRTLWKKSKIETLKKLFALLKSIKKGNYEVAFDLSLAQEYGFFLCYLGIKERIGYDYRKRGIFLNKKLEIDGYEDMHMVEYYLNLLKFIDVDLRFKELLFPLKQEYIQWAERFLNRYGIHTCEFIIGIIPGGGSSWGSSAYRKHWPVNKFAQLANMILRNRKVPILILGDKDELGLCNQLSSLLDVEPVVICGKMDILQFTAIIKLCKLIICNDGGPLHIAVSQGTKTFSIFGPVDPKVYGPYPPSKDHIVITKELRCRPCYRRFKIPECKHFGCLETLDARKLYTELPL